MVYNYMSERVYITATLYKIDCIKSIFSFRLKNECAMKVV